LHVLAQIATPQAVDLLMQNLEAADVPLRESALAGLAGGAGRWAAPLIVALLDDPSLAKAARQMEPLNVEWPASHAAHSALHNYLARFGLPGSGWLNLRDGQTNDVPAEMTRARTWWREHGPEFLAGKDVPDPELSTVMYIDP
jgi:HEAT repeat protein